MFVDTARSALAIIAPLPESSSIPEAILAREVPIHQAALIAIVALFIIGWMTLSDSRQPQHDA